MLPIEAGEVIKDPFMSGTIVYSEEKIFRDVDHGIARPNKVSHGVSILLSINKNKHVQMETPTFLNPKLASFL